MTELYERWKPVKGYEGLYEVSDWGRIRSLDHYVNYKSKSKRLVKGKILKTSKRGDYLAVQLSKQNKQKTHSIHNLVAEAFLPNPNNLPCVNHKSECKFFNHYSTLEWCDYTYNTIYGTSQERRRKKLLNRQNMSKKVLQYSNSGEFIKEWPSTMEIQRVLGIPNTNISNCCTGKKHYKTAGGFIWRYAS